MNTGQARKGVKRKKKIIFIGTPLPESMLKTKRVRNANIADNIAQNTMINGLHKYYGKNLTVITVSPYERPSKIDLNSIEAIGVANNRFNRFSYYLSITKNYTLKLREVLKDNKDFETIIVTAGPYIYLAVPALLARWKYGARWVPFLLGAVEVPNVKFPLSLISKLSRWTIAKADGAITYTSSNARDYMPGKPYLEIFYLVGQDMIKVYKDFIPVQPNKFTITYTGALTSIYNINTIIDVIKRTGDSYRWVFAGGGKYASKIKKISQNKKYDVEYLGSVSNADAIKLQMSSHLLLSLRGGRASKAIRYYNKYAASGKLTEYLYSGTPILAGDVEAFSDTFKQFMICEKNQSAQHISTVLKQIEREYDKKKALALKGRSFAFRDLNSEHQNKEIYNFLKGF